jgi:hypothetical protein
MLTCRIVPAGAQVTKTIEQEQTEITEFPLSVSVISCSICFVGRAVAISQTLAHTFAFTFVLGKHHFSREFFRFTLFRQFWTFSADGVGTSNQVA